MSEMKNEIFIETRRIGGLMHVTAIDAETGIEVSFQAPATAGREHITLLAKNKLQYVKRKKNDSK